MERDDLRQIAREYGDEPVVFLDEEGIRENALVLGPEGAGWRVWWTDERAGRWGDGWVVDSEQAALECARDRVLQHARTTQLMARARRRRALPSAEPALAEVKATVAELRAFMLRYDVERLRYGVTTLSGILESAEPPVDVLLALREAHDEMEAFPPRDGWSEAHVVDGTGGVDRGASTELEEMKRRLRQVLEAWTLEESGDGPGRKPLR